LQPQPIYRVPQESGDEVTVSLGGELRIAASEDALDGERGEAGAEQEHRRRVRLMPTSA